MSYQEYTVRVYSDCTEWRNKEGLFHRTDGPAIEYTNGGKEWYQNGQLHRTDGPALEYTNGDKSWYQNGQLHRTDGPAIEHTDGTKHWYQNDQLHRTDGPAIEYADGSKHWYLNGMSFPEASWKLEVAKLQSPPADPCDGKEIVIEGKTYKLIAV